MSRKLVAVFAIVAAVALAWLIANRPKASWIYGPLEDDALEIEPFIHPDVIRSDWERARAMPAASYRSIDLSGWGEPLPVFDTPLLDLQRHRRVENGFDGKAPAGRAQTERAYGFGRRAR